jgi:hypothetical protein
MQNGGATWSIADDVSFRLTDVPEPATWSVVAIAALALARFRQVRRSRESLNCRLSDPCSLAAGLVCNHGKKPPRPSSG